jgi:uncharacterized membrane protein
METLASTPAERRTSAPLTAGILAVVLAVAILFAASTNWYTVFKTVHVTFAVLWVGGGVLLTILALMAERRNDPAELATIARQAATVGEKYFSTSGVIVVAMGVAMMINGDLPWSTFWIDFGLAVFAVSFLTGIVVLGPQSRRLHAIIDEKGALAPEAQEGIKKILLIARVDVALLLIVVVDMVAKPFS